MGETPSLNTAFLRVREARNMAELKDVRRPKQVAPRLSGWMLDMESDEAAEPVVDPYGGRLFGDHAVFDYDDQDSDRIGDSHGLFDF